MSAQAQRRTVGGPSELSVVSKQPHAQFKWSETLLDAVRVARMAADHPLTTDLPDPPLVPALPRTSSGVAARSGGRSRSSVTGTPILDFTRLAVAQYFYLNRYARRRRR